MKIHLDDITVFKNFIQLLKVVNEEQTLTIDENGIEAITMDPSHIVMVKASLKKTDGFNLDDFSKDQVRLALNVDEVTRVLDRIDKKETVKLEYNEELAKFIVNAKRSGQNRNFRLNVMEPFEDELPDPKINFSAEARMTTAGLEKALKDVALFSEHVVIKATESNMIITGAGDIGDYGGEYDKNSDEILNYAWQEDCQSTFTNSIILGLIQAAKKAAEVVEVKWSTDMPIEIKVEAKASGLEATYYCAPCIGV
jgi:proliferating cell nuclear antigen PCNA